MEEKKIVIFLSCNLKGAGFARSGGAYKTLFWAEIYLLRGRYFFCFHRRLYAVEILFL